MAGWSQTPTGERWGKKEGRNLCRKLPAHVTARLGPSLNWASLCWQEGRLGSAQCQWVYPWKCSGKVGKMVPKKVKMSSDSMCYKVSSFRAFSAYLEIWTPDRCDFGAGRIDWSFPKGKAPFSVTWGNQACPEQSSLGLILYFSFFTASPIFLLQPPVTHCDTMHGQTSHSWLPLSAVMKVKFKLTLGIQCTCRSCQLLP